MERQTTAAQIADANSDALLGVWNLDVKTPLGQHPATLTLRRDAGGTASGDIDTKLGSVELHDVALGPDGFEAAATHNFQGKDYGARVSAELSGAQLSGTIKISHPLVPQLKFTGTRQ